MRIRESIIFDYPFMGFRFFEPLRDNRIQEFLFVQPFFFHIQTDIPLCLLFGREVGHGNFAVVAEVRKKFLQLNTGLGRFVETVA